MATATATLAEDQINVLVFNWKTSMHGLVCIHSICKYWLWFTAPRWAFNAPKGSPKTTEAITTDNAQSFFLLNDSLKASKLLLFLAQCKLPMPAGNQTTISPNTYAMRSAVYVCMCAVWVCTHYTHNYLIEYLWLLDCMFNLIECPSNNNNNYNSIAQSEVSC